MYEDTYEEYIRSILGYPSQNMYANSMPNAYVPTNVEFANRELEKYYPDGFPEYAKKNAGIAQQYLFHYIRNLSVQSE